jgi:hypothetical protein
MKCEFEPNTIRPRTDPMAVITFCFALIAFGLPTQADLAFGAMLSGQWLTASLVSAACYTIVLLPLFFAIRRSRRQPNIWYSRGWLFGTLLLVSWNAFWNVLLLVGLTAKLINKDH